MIILQMDARKHSVDCCTVDMQTRGWVYTGVLIHFVSIRYLVVEDIHQLEEKLLK